MFETPPDERARRSGGRWLTASLVLVLGLLLVAVVGLSTGGAQQGLVVFIGVLAVLGVSAWLSPLRPGKHTEIGDTALTRPEVVVLWRPGCAYSARLKRDAARHGVRVKWVNIWRDPEAAAICRRLNGGSEETPTVVVVDRDMPQPTVIPATVSGVSAANKELAEHRSIASPTTRPRRVA